MSADLVLVLPSWIAGLILAFASVLAVVMWAYVAFLVVELFREWGHQ